MEDLFELSAAGYKLRSHCYKLSTRRSYLEVRRHFFSHHIVSYCNWLPSYIAEALSIKSGAL